MRIRNNSLYAVLCANTMTACPLKADLTPSSSQLEAARIEPEENVGSKKIGG